MKCDYPYLARLIATTWEFDTFCSPRVAKYLSYVYLDACLIEQNFSQVALMNGQIAGVIMAQSAYNYKASFWAQLRRKWHLTLLKLTDEGCEVLSFFEHIDMIDKQLLIQTEHPYQGKVELFIVDSAYQGHGLGKKLFDKTLEFFKEHQVNDFYLFTDSSCNIGFYEHAGMRRRGHHPFYYQEQGSEQCLDMYIYDSRNYVP